MKRILLFFLLLMTVRVAAQEETPTPTAPAPVLNSAISAEFFTDNLSPLLGEPFTVTLEVIADPSIVILDWARFEMPLEVLEEGELITETNASGDAVYTRDYQVVLWEVGEYLSEEVVVTYQQGGSISGAPVSAFYVQVPIQIPNPLEAQPQPFAPNIDLPFISQWVWIGAIAVGIILMLIIARLVQLSRRGVIQIVNASPAEKAIAEIEDLKAQNLPPAAIYELVALSLRRYIDGQFDLNAIEMTTAELSDTLRTLELFPKQHRGRLQQVLEQADLVKFARFQPDETSSVRLANFAIKWLRETERLQRD